MGKKIQLSESQLVSLIERVVKSQITEGKKGQPFTKTTHPNSKVTEGDENAPFTKNVKSSGNKNNTKLNAKPVKEASKLKKVKEVAKPTTKKKVVKIKESDIVSIVEKLIAENSKKK